ncbi:MAG: sensor domain-containing phosphodiesterase [Ilumatobacter fluminis]|uniref:putative bifunctional diguanylate cyclase/phosphodiesterase n=1 Tax=Ilumatobacter fluminis TaxID=467091 RepID=UPI0032EC4C96
MSEPITASVRQVAGPERDAGRLSPNTQAWMIVVGMTAIVVIGGLVMPWPSDPLRSAPAWILIPIAIAHALAERAAFDIEVGEEGHSYSLSEIPTAFAVVFLSPPLALAARLVGAIPNMYRSRRNRGVKLAFNLALFSMEMVVALLVSRFLVRWWGDSDGILLGALAIAMVVSGAAVGFAVALVVSRFEGTLLAGLRVEVLSMWWYYAFNNVYATMAVALALVQPWLVLVVVPASFGIWSVLRRFGSLVQDLRDLDDVHGFAGRVGSSLDTDAIATHAVADIVDLMRADGAALLRVDGAELDTHIAGRLPLRLPQSVDDDFWRLLTAFPDERLVSSDDLRPLGVVTDQRLRTIAVAPILDEGRVFAVLVVAERNVQRFRFAESDLPRLRNMADQVAVSLRRGLLHKQLEYEARHDALTDLPGRTLFEWAVSSALADDSGRLAAVMMLDLDRFKEVNDTLGHHAGDALLVEFSRRISAILREGDMLARLAGDEFALLCYRDDTDGLVESARRCVEIGGSPVVLDGLEIVVTVSVGVAVIDDGETDPMQPIRRADIAMYNAKWQRSGVELYRDEIDRRTPARLSMLGDLRTAIEGDEIDVVFQPKLELGTGRVVGAEALVRWESPTRGRVSPAEFVRVAEDTGLIKDLTDLVLKRGIAALRMFDDAGLGLRLAINLSTHDLFDTKLPARVLTQLEYNQVQPSELTLEITESSLLVDAPRTRATIDDLHAAGFRLAIDDFGTGYSSLSYLRRLPVQELKIDQSFVSGMLLDPQDEVIVRSTIDLGHNLRLSVVAEGVEDEATLHALASMGCDVAQGFWIARPLSAPELIAWVIERRRSTATGQELPSVSRPG